MFAGDLFAIFLISEIARNPTGWKLVNPNTKNLNRDISDAIGTVGH